MIEKTNLQQKVDKKIYAIFRGELMKKGIPIQNGLERAMEAYTEILENSKNDDLDFVGKEK